jgi:PAS domain S-box-containing protein
MNDEKKTKAQLIQELAELRQHVIELQKQQSDTPPPTHAKPKQTLIAASRQMKTHLLTESHQFRDVILENTHMMAVFLDAQFNFIWVNRAYATTCRHDAAFFPGKNHFDLYPHAENQAIFQRVVDTGEPFFVAAKPFEFPDQPKRGVTYWDWSLIPVKDNAGEVTGLVFTLADVTGQFKAEKAQQDSEEKYRLLAENVSDVLWILDLEAQRFRYVSPSVERLRGYTPEQVMEQDVSAALTPASAHNVQLLIADRLAKLQAGYTGPFTDELEQPRKDGTTIWTEVTTHYAHNKSTGRLEVFGVSRDITKRRQAEIALVESKLRYQTFFEQNPDGVVIINPETAGFVEFNDQVCKQLGYTRDEFARLTIIDVEAKETAEETKAHIRQVMATGRNDFDTKQKTKQGEIRDVHVSARMIDVGDKKIYHCIWRDITDLKRYEHELRIAKEKAEESEQKYRLFFQKTSEKFFILNPDGTFRFMNEAYASLFHKIPSEVIGKKISEIFPPNEAKIRLDLLHRTIASGKKGHSELIHKTDSGDIVRNRATLEPIYDVDGKLLWVSGIATDITERKHAEEKLRESEQRFGTIFRTSPVGIAITSIDDGKIVDINPALTKILGYTIDEFIGHTTLELNVWADHQQRSEMINLLREQGSINDFEATCRRKSGEIGTLLVSADVMVLVGQEYMLSMMYDITERKQAEQARAESEMRYRAIFENSTEAILFAAPDGTIYKANPAACIMFGRTEQEICALGRNGIVNLDDPRLKQVLDERKRTGKFAGELTHLRRDGTPFPVDIVSTIYKDPTGQECSTVFIRDITERKQAEEKLQMSEERLRLALEATTDAIWDWDLTSGDTYFSPRWYEILGYNPDEIEMKSKAWVALAHPDDKDAALKIIYKAIENGSNYEVEFRSKHADGHWVWCLVKGKVSARDVDGKPIRMSGSISDITRRKEMEEALSQSEIKYRRIFENAIIGIFQTTPDGRLLNANDAFARMFGYNDANDMLGADIRVQRDLYAQPYDRSKVLTAMQKEDKIGLWELEVKKQDKTQFWVSASMRKVKDQDGNVLYFEGASIDITERKLTQEKLQVSEERFRTLFMSMNEGFYLSEVIYDDHGNPCDYRYLEVNPKFEQMIGLPRDQIIGKRYKELVPVDTTQWLNTYFEVARTGIACTYYFHSPEYLKHFETYTYQPTKGRVSVLVVDITERKEAEEKLDTQQRRTAAILAGIADTFYSLDPDWQFTVVNPAAERAPFARPASELLGKKIWDLYPNLLGTPIHKRYVNAAKNHTLEHYEAQSPLNQRWYEVFMQGWTRGVDVYMRDITDRKQAENALRESEEKLRLLSNNLPNGMVYQIDSGEDGQMRRFSYVSSGVETLHGITVTDAVNDPMSIYGQVLEEDRLLIAERETIALAAMSPFSVEVRLQMPSGNIRWRSFNSAPRRLPNNHVVWDGIEIDITERKQSEVALQKSESQLATALQMAHAGHWEYDINSDTFTFNDNFYHIFKTTAEEVGGYNMSASEYAQRFCHPDDAIQVAKETLAAIEAADPAFSRQLEHRILYASGDVGYIQVRFSIIKDQQGRTIKTFGVNQDITDRKRDEEERAKLETQLRRSQKLETIGTLAGGIAHDFNNILTPIMGYADMALTSLPPSNPLVDDLGQILKGAIRAKELVEQILTFSRQLETERKPLNLHLIVKEAIKLLRPSIPATIDIRQRIDASCDKVMADAAQMHQVIVNLCTNAYQAMEDNGGTLTVELKQVSVDAATSKIHSNLKEAEYVRLTVHDTGPGMNERTMERIFEPFFTTKAVNKGTGMGLSVVHGIIRKHGGDIIVYSEPGKGSAFHVYLPTVKAELEIEKKISTVIPGGNEFILIVDDERAVANVLMKMLQRLGYTVDVYNSSIEALKVIRRQADKYDLMISDLTMPDMTGLELAQQLQKIRADMPVILMTGYGDNLTEDVHVSHGIQKVVAKPIDLRELATAIRQVIKK